MVGNLFPSFNNDPFAPETPLEVRLARFGFGPQSLARENVASLGRVTGRPNLPDPGQVERRIGPTRRRDPLFLDAPIEAQIMAQNRGPSLTQSFNQYRDIITGMDTKARGLQAIIDDPANAGLANVQTLARQFLGRATESRNQLLPLAGLYDLASSAFEGGAGSGQYDLGKSRVVSGLRSVQAEGGLLDSNVGVGAEASARAAYDTSIKSVLSGVLTQVSSNRGAIPLPASLAGADAILGRTPAELGAYNRGGPGALRPFNVR